jgi:hypothetical protein
MDSSKNTLFKMVKNKLMYFQDSLREKKRDSLHLSKSNTNVYETWKIIRDNRVDLGKLFL